MTTTEHAANIRATLKRLHHWNSRHVSVRAEYFSLGSSIEVTIKDPSIPLPPVKAIAKQAERIHRCDVTGEILGGGNRYVSVRYSTEAQDIIGRRYADAVQRAVDSLAPESNSLAKVEGTEFLIGRPDAWRFSIWGDSHITETNSVERAAQIIGNLILAHESPHA